MRFEDNNVGTRVIDIDTFETNQAQYIRSFNEALRLQNVRGVHIQASEFNQNQVSGGGATIFNEYTRALNEDNDGPTLYDFVVGFRDPYFRDEDVANLVSNRFTEMNAAYSIYVLNNAEDNVIGTLAPGHTGAERGIIVNNNRFRDKLRPSLPSKALCSSRMKKTRQLT